MGPRDWGYDETYPEAYPDHLTFKIYILNYTPYSWSKGSGYGDSSILYTPEEWDVPPAHMKTPFPDSSVVPGLFTAMYKWTGDRRKPNDARWWMVQEVDGEWISWAIVWKYNETNPIPTCTADGGANIVVDVATVNMDPSVEVVPEGEERTVWYRVRMADDTT